MDSSARALIFFGLAVLTSAACGGSGGGGAPDGTDAPGPASAVLSQAADCETLHASIRTDARAKIRVQAEGLRGAGWWYDGDGGVPLPRPTAPGAFPRPAPTPASDAGPPRDGATDTNTQVPGVDEADVVETDGERLYLVQRGATGDTLFVLRAVPPETTAIEARHAIEGATYGMFVAAGRALVVSAVVDDGRLGGDSRCGGIGLPLPALPFDQPILGAPPQAGLACPAIFTKLTLLDLGTSPPRVARELYVEGTYLAARRHENRARVLIQRGWGGPPGVGDPWGRILTPPPPIDEEDFRARVDAWEAEALAAVDAGTLEDWLPAVRERVGTGFVERPLACERTHVPPPGHARHGVMLVVGVDLASDDAPLDDTTLLGLASHVYANADTLVLASSEWQAVPFGEADARTALHVFALPPASLATRYRGSGFVPGTVLSQFALDAADGVIRAATSSRRHDGLTVTRVTTARLEGDTLETLGTTPDLAPGEQLRGARFLGTTAYLVTFQQIDPLFVVDLADPRNPRVLGEVEMPGFSTYLHPLDARHLLTLGRAGDARGWVRGPALRIFDVGDPAAPRLTAEYELAPEESSPAESDHQAFTYDARLGLLALPANGWNGGTTARLHLFAVDAATGIALRGTIEHGSDDAPGPCLPTAPEACGPAELEVMQRGLFIGDAVYSLGSAALQVHALSDLTTPLAAVPLR